MKKVLMILTSHRLDCFKLCMDLLIQGKSIRYFDEVVLLLNGVKGRHLQYIDTLQRKHADISWTVISGPRGRGKFISGLQNQCVEKFPDALYFKIDEDTFVSSDWAEKLHKAYLEYNRDTNLSLITPIIANNSRGFYSLLELFPDLKKEYQDTFPHPITYECSGTVWKYPQVADWITRKFINLEEGNAALRARLQELGTPVYETFSYRFSINCIMYDYRHWKEIGGVQTDDELGWGDWISENKKDVVLVKDAFCHHYSFFIQQDWLDRHALLEDLRAANLPDTLHKGSAAYHVPRLQRIIKMLPRVLKNRIMPAT